MSPTIMHPERMPVPEKPRSWDRFERRYPSVAEAYDNLSDVCRSAGPLDERVVAVAKLAVSVGAASDRYLENGTPWPSRSPAN